MNKIIKIIATSLVFLGIALPAFGALVIPELLVRVGVGLTPKTANDTMGTAAIPWSWGYFTNLSVAGYLTAPVTLTSYGGVTAPWFVATSTTAVNTFAGNTAIGSGSTSTSTPGFPLVVTSTGGVQAMFSGFSTTSTGVNLSTNNGSIQLGNNNLWHGKISFDYTGQTYMYIDNAYNSDNSRIMFRTKTASSPFAPVNAMTITGSGNVGIGTITPTSRLTVAGDTSISGAINQTTTFATSTIEGPIILSPAKSTIGNYQYLNVGSYSTLSTHQSSGGMVMGYGVISGTSSATALLSNTTVSLPRMAIDFAGSSGMRFFTGAAETTAVGSPLVNSVERMRIDTNGNVGIGTTTPWGKLSITNTGADPSFVVEDSTSPDTSPFIVDASGNVGVGTTSLNYKLNVSGDIYGFGDTRTTGVFSAGNGSVANAAFRFINDADTGMYLPANGKLSLITGGVDRVYIDNSGNVGIGTTTPLVRLNVISDSTGGATVAPVLGTQGGAFTVSGYTGLYGLSMGNITVTGASWLQAQRYDTATAYNLLLNPAGGNVGIGTTTPVANLQVTTSTANATTSLQFGKPSQNKGTCMTYYDTAGSPVYAYIPAGTTAFVYQNGGTAPDGCKN